MRATILPCIAIVLLGARSSLAATIHVPADHSTIQAALDAAEPGDEVLVAAGSYPEFLQMKNGVALRSESGPGLTWIGGPAAGPSRVSFVDVAEAEFDGFTVGGGGGTALPGILAGGGILCLRSSPTLRNLVVSGCTLEVREPEYGVVAGAGIACLEGSHPDIQDTAIRGCEIYDEPKFGTTGMGGGLYCDQASGPRVRRCRIEGNQATLGGGVASRSPAMAMDHSLLRDNRSFLGGGFHGEGRIEDCVFEGNSAGSGPVGRGGGAFLQGAAVLEECLLRANSSAEAGAVCVLGGSARLAGNTLWGNAIWSSVVIYHSGEATILLEGNIIAGAGGGGYGVVVEGPGDPPQIRCNDVWGHTDGGYAGIPDPTGTAGNFSLDPLFCSPESGDFTLDGSSPCLPGRHPKGADCDLIGAFGQGCGAIAAERTTWGAARARLAR